MNVQQLIDSLQKIEDKTREVCFDTEAACFNCHLVSIDSVSDDPIEYVDTISLHCKEYDMITYNRRDLPEVKEAVISALKDTQSLIEYDNKKLIEVYGKESEEYIQRKGYTRSILIVKEQVERWEKK